MYLKKYALEPSSKLLDIQISGRKETKLERHSTRRVYYFRAQVGLKVSSRKVRRVRGKSRAVMVILGRRAI